jgi:hypothetical protein
MARASTPYSVWEHESRYMRTSTLLSAWLLLQTLRTRASPREPLPLLANRILSKFMPPDAPVCLSDGQRCLVVTLLQAPPGCRDTSKDPRHRLLEIDASEWGGHCIRVSVDEKYTYAAQP